jgi:nucleotide-binding universal stress UspA family protein
MEKKVLLCVDGSQASRWAVDYVAMMESSVLKGLKITLFHAMNPVPPFLRREAQTKPELFRNLRAMEQKYRQEANEVLKSAKARLMEKGAPAANIETLAMPRASDAARDILFHAEQGLYDAVVLGRRGLSKAQELFVGSVTNKVVQHADRTPVWIVGGQVTNEKVLCAVDGSEGSLRAVDHVAFMLGHNPDVVVNLFHVTASLASYCPIDFSEELQKEIQGDLMKSDKECMDNFFSRAVKVLEEGGIDQNRISTSIKNTRMGISKAIANEMAEGGYGTLAMGRRGENRSFFLGGVSDRMLAKGSSAALWIAG